MSSSKQHDSATAPDPERLEKFKRVFAQAYVPRDIYGSSDLITVEWPDDFDELCDVQVIMRHSSGRIYAEANKLLDADNRTVTLRKGLNCPDGLYHAVIRPKALEYYNGTQYERAIPFFVVNGDYSTSHYGDLESRREEFLRYAAAQGSDVYCELARLALGEPIRERVLIDAADQAVEDGNWSLLGLFYMVGRYGDRLPVELAATLNGTLRRMDYDRFNDSIFAMVCKLIAATLYKRKDGDLLEVQNWLHLCASRGFNLSSRVDKTIQMLVAIIDLVDELTELAAVVLDKLLFTLALHTTDFVIDGRLSPLTPVTRFLWGLGLYNHNHSTCTMLACSKNYEIPSPIQAVAIETAEKHSARDTQRVRGDVVQRTLYRTSDYSLVSMGNRWVAQLGYVHILQPVPVDNAVSQTDNMLHYVSNNISRVYWPTYEFDDWLIDKNWAFAQVSDGYIALHCNVEIGLSNDVTKHERELIAEGEEIHWYCRMGRAADDGTFEEFKAAVMAEGPQTVEPDLLPENRHYDSPFCVADFDQPTMDIRYKDYVMRLDFSSEHEGEA